MVHVTFSSDDCADSNMAIGKETQGAREKKYVDRVLNRQIINSTFL